MVESAEARLGQAVAQPGMNSTDSSPDAVAVGGVRSAPVGSPRRGQGGLSGSAKGLATQSRWESLSREELLALVSVQADTIGRLEAVVAAQAQTIEQQAARIGELERRLSRNSGNSSMPPSTDDLPGRTPPAEQAKQGKDAPRRKRGKQPGAAGAHLAWSENPDQRLDHFPAGRCGCGLDLAGARDLGVAASHQVHDIPQVSVTVSQHDLHRVRCGCGAEHVAARPDGVADGPVSYGVNLQALCVYLMVVHSVPVQRCAQLVTALTGAAPSEGFVHGLLQRTHQALAEVDARIRTLITLAYAVCLDETPLRVGPKRTKKHLLVACTNLYTHYLLADRSLESFLAFVLPELTGAVVVHDRYHLYDSKKITEARAENGLAALVHQLCVAHLLRDLAAVAQAYPDEHWPTQIADALRGLVHAANTARDDGHDHIDETVKAELTTKFEHGVRVGLKDIPPAPPGDKQPEFRHLLEVLRDRQDDVLRFAQDLAVPPTSNQAERDVRPGKTQQKISGRLTSEKVTSYRYRIAGYASTAAKHGINVLQAIRDALLGRPWMPPTPTTR